MIISVESELVIAVDGITDHRNSADLIMEMAERFKKVAILVHGSNMRSVFDLVGAANFPDNVVIVGQFRDFETQSRYDAMMRQWNEVGLAVVGGSSSVQPITTIFKDNAIDHQYSFDIDIWCYIHSVGDVAIRAGTWGGAAVKYHTGDFSNNKKFVNGIVPFLMQQRFVPLVSAFPGTGKTSLIARQKECSRGAPHIDVEGSSFPRDNPDDPFPDNYIRAITKQYISSKKLLVTVSSREDYRRLYQKAGLNYVLYYPHKSLKNEYLQRYIKRGDKQEFVDYMAEGWDTFIGQCMDDGNANHIVMKSGQYLTDVWPVVARHF